MKRLWLIPIGFVALVIPVAVLAGSGQGGFDGVVTSIESRYHVRATRIPFLGLSASSRARPRRAASTASTSPSSSTSPSKWMAKN